MNDTKGTTKPKFYFNHSTVKGWDPDKKRYLDFPTEEEYYEYLKEEENE